MYKLLIRLRFSILVYLTHRMALPVLKIIRKQEVFPYGIVALKHFPKHTLGNDLFNFLELKQLKLLPYYARHDIKHILLDYDTTDEGECCLQCFMLGNGHIYFPVIATILFGFTTMPEYWKQFRLAFIRGSKAMPISNWDWFALLHEYTITLKNKINNFSKQKL